MAAYKEEKIKIPEFNEANGFYTTKERSALMSKIRGKDTKPEIKLRKVLWGLGIRYRKNHPKLPGKPDIVSKKYKLVIFVDGEFWHGYNWAEQKEKIKTNRDYWIPKIERNMQRDRENNLALEAMGYKVFRFWGNEIKNNLGRCIKEILDYISQNRLKNI